jgi:hypothetical protein
MLTAVKLSDQWAALERRLPTDWESIALRLRTEEPDQLPEAARILGPAGVGVVGDELALTVRRAGGASGPEAVRRLFARLDAARIWSVLEQQAVAGSPPRLDEPATETRAAAISDTWDRALDELPPGWSDLLCRLELDSSALLPRAALICAPLNPTRDRGGVAFLFRCARTKGYGVSPGMARRCFEQLDAEEITGTVSVVRSLSETDNVATQGAVWYVGGKVL